MTTSDLKKRLIDKIRETDDSAILEEIYRLLDMETEDSEICKLSDERKNVIHEAQEQIKKGNYLTDDKVNRNIDEWLNE